MQIQTDMTSVRKKRQESPQASLRGLCRLQAHFADAAWALRPRHRLCSSLILHPTTQCPVFTTNDSIDEVSQAEAVEHAESADPEMCLSLMLVLHYLFSPPLSLYRWGTSRISAPVQDVCLLGRYDNHNLSTSNSSLCSSICTLQSTAGDDEITLVFETTEEEKKRRGEKLVCVTPSTHTQ